MAIVHAGLGLNFDYLLLTGENVVDLKQTRLAFSYENTITEFTGHGFSYDASGVTGGTVTGYAEYFNNRLVVSISDLDLPAAWVYERLNEYDRNSVISEIFKGDDLIIGSFVDDNIRSYDGNDYIFGGLGNDVIDAGNGNDIINAGAGQNTIDGGSGRDTVIFASDRASYQFNRNDHNITVAHYLGESNDTIVNVERFQFTDGTLAFDTDGHAGQAFRLYQAAFDRAPDYSGLGYWIGTLDDGSGLTDVAARFIDSDEFKAIYGYDVSNSQFVDKLYQNILNRDGDEGGRTFWTEELNAGHRSRAQVLADFSESDENVVGVAPSINDGIWFV